MDIEKNSIPHIESNLEVAYSLYLFILTIEALGKGKINVTPQFRMSHVSKRTFIT